MAVDSTGRKQCVRLGEKESGVFREFAQILEQVSSLIGSKKCLNCTKPVHLVGVVGVFGDTSPKLDGAATSRELPLPAQKRSARRFE